LILGVNGHDGREACSVVSGTSNCSISFYSLAASPWLSWVCGAQENLYRQYSQQLDLLLRLDATLPYNYAVLLSLLILWYLVERIVL